MPSFSPSAPGLTSGDTSSISSLNTNTTASAASDATGSIREDENAVLVGRETSQHRQRQRQRQNQRQRQSLDRERVSVTVTSNNSLSGPAASASASRASTRAARSTTSISHSSSSWSTAAPSISSAAPSLLATYDANADAEELELDGDRDGSGNGIPLGIDVEGLNLNANSDSVSHSSSQPDPRIYTCLFHMLDCYESFVDESHWRTHVLSHFRTHPPPHTARCPLCANTKFVDGDPNPLSSPVTRPESDERDKEREEEEEEEEDKKQGKGPQEDGQEDETEPEPELQRASIRRVDSGTDVRDDGPYTGIEYGLGLETTGNSVSISTELDQSHWNPRARWHESEIEYNGSAWRRLLDHVGAHYRSGQTLAGSRADFELMRYLYGRRIISDAQFKAMQLAPAPSSPAYHASQDGVRASIGSSDEPYCAPYSRRREERMRGQQKGVSVGVV